MAFPEKRTTRRVSDALALRIEESPEQAESAQAESIFDQSPLDSTPTHVVNLSTGGLRFLHETKLEENKSLRLTLRLGPKNETISIQAIVISSVEEKTQSGNKRYNARVRFTNVNNTARNLLEQHISHVLNQTHQYYKEYSYKASA